MSASTKPLVSVEEYLHMTFDGADCEYVDGEIVERNMGDAPHSAVQGRLIEIFYDLRKTIPLYARPELRHRVKPTRYRIPDVAVYEKRPTELVPSDPPFIAIEVVSPDDTYSKMIEKLKEYRAWGAKHIWLIDPRLRLLFVLTSDGLTETGSLDIPEYGVAIQAAEIFSELG